MMKPRIALAALAAAALTWIAGPAAAASPVLGAPSTPVPWQATQPPS